MRKLYAKGILIGFATALLCGLVLMLSAKDPYRGVITKLTGSESYQDKLNASHEVETYIEKAIANKESTKLIIGDSVCNSLFGDLADLNPDYSILCCNKGITMAGQYILAKDYLDTHENVTDVYLIVISNSMITGFDTDFGYQYAVMPFVKTDKIKYLDDETIEEMKNLYLSPFVSKKMVYFVEESPLMKKLYLNILKQFKPTKLTLSYPDVTTRYILKIQKLCEERDVTMHFISPPLADTPQRREVESTLQAEYEASALYEYFPNYYEGYLYYPAEWFADGIHPSVDRSQKNDMVREMEKTNHESFHLILE